ncbi:carbohydrate porin [Pseudomonas sp. ATCC 13867]|uniref:carbohydrate porin n=1 Tax=Pseudomonas sp. ATCC 13867 TaxID=1294143 RepID=UPI000346A72E|nr:carbohydrate porin [Pseudomonas sp. ATCC 13867]
MKKLPVLPLLTSFGLLIGALPLHAAEAFSSDSPWMLGDWGGTRSKLLEQGYDFTFGYTGEAAANLGGGYDNDRTARYTDQVTLGTHLDLQKIFGWNATDFQLTVTERNGNSLSSDRINDPRAAGFSQVQEVYGRGQTWRLTQMWMSRRFFDDRLDIKAGRMGEAEDFNSFPCDFQNLAFCGSQIGAWDGGVWYNWPVSQWGLRIKYEFAPQWFVQIGAYEQNPSNLETGNGFKLSGSGTKGTLIPVELLWKPSFAGLPGEYRIGAFHSSADADDVLEGTDGRPQPLSGGDFRQHSSKRAYWLVAQQQITSRGGSNARGLSLFANLTVHDEESNPISRFIQFGATYAGPFDARPKDTLGLGFSQIHASSDYRQRQAIANQVNGVSDYSDPRYLPLPHDEYNAELFYGIHATNWLTIRPNLQYVRYPGGVKEIDDAWVAGLKFSSTF